jgi:Putative DNA-binding domain
MLEQDFNAGLVGAKNPHLRFPIYRNNVLQALINALRVRYPVVEQLVGPQYFAVMAGKYVSSCKPKSAVLINYGASFADFLVGFEGTQALSYLSEVAQFENAWWDAYHAAEALPLYAIVLSEVPPEDWGDLKFAFHPSVKLFHATQGAVGIWQWHQIPDNSQELSTLGEEFVIVSRPHAEVDVRLIAAGAFSFLVHLQRGLSLEVALSETHKVFPEFDLQSILGAMFQLELIIGVTK